MVRPRSLPRCVVRDIRASFRTASSARTPRRAGPGSGGAQARPGLTSRLARSAPPRAGLAWLAVAALAGVSLVAAGCGGSSSPAVARIAPSTGDADASTSAAASDSGPGSPAAYSACMRSHGVPTFPDPNSQGLVQVTPGMGIDPRSPAFTAAQQACQRLSSGAPSSQPQRQTLQGERRFSTCMRDHGVPAFPDPDAQGELTKEMMNAAGIDVSAPAVEAAARTCLPAADGAITASQIRQAETSAHSPTDTAP
jgi:hypothetical protein